MAPSDCGTIQPARPGIATSGLLGVYQTQVLQCSLRGAGDHIFGVAAVAGMAVMH